MTELDALNWRATSRALASHWSGRTAGSTTLGHVRFPGVLESGLDHEEVRGSLPYCPTHSTGTRHRVRLIRAASLCEANPILVIYFRQRATTCGA
jgi:hypothetical protein